MKPYIPKVTICLRLALVLCAYILLTGTAQSRRSRENFDNHWQFHKGGRAYSSCTRQFLRDEATQADLHE
ncbi:hypothetical protein GO730_17185 [Spirosoma sp. HMF3257]|uniref:Uncharacterized protein n=1 Tax=Spirosoma telluris TaxID=2183553 RepID=A0A327NJS6_9BACT|nr:hypothetical protein [Spirosoma telluris]RAI75457.1 hypothetical protein HMF3257_17110 [Spirosoma telluris]